ncbi:MAG: potassium transporter [Gammaproteobacteria bacterium]|nr:potassium transporter [Gammaproteobacteria bacterium]
MQYKTVVRLTGLFLMLFSFSMIPPLIICWKFAENICMPFVESFGIILGCGYLLWRPFRHHHSLLKIREGFLIVVTIWFAISFFASFPFLLFPELHQNHSTIDILFEAVSGITTTGASTFTDLDTLPNAILYYRQQLQFIGGMGIIVLAIAIFPMLGMGGTHLFRLEVSSSHKENKLTPRIAQTAKLLWAIYCLITLACTWCFWYAGMDWFHALGESFSTVSTGGFSMHDDSFFYYRSHAIEIFACVFMLIGSINFSLHYIALQQHTLKNYWQDEEFRTYIIVFFLLIILIVGNLLLHNHFLRPKEQIIDSVFMIISIATTTGFSLIPFDDWASFDPILLIFMSLIGGCAGSTTGGLKFLRLMVISKQSKREFERLLHPQASIPVKMDRNPIAENIIQSITSFAFLYLGLFALFILIFMALGNDFITSFSSIAAALANSGTGDGQTSLNFKSISEPSKCLLIITMLLGRLQIYPIFILFTRPFWKK